MCALCGECCLTVSGNNNNNNKSPFVASSWSHAYLLNSAKTAVSLLVCRYVLLATIICLTMSINCRTGGSAVGMRPLACWDRGFEFRRGLKCPLL